LYFHFCSHLSHFDAAYRELVLQQKLQLRAKPAEQASEASLYDIPLDQRSRWPVDALKTNGGTHKIRPDPVYLRIDRATRRQQEDQNGSSRMDRGRDTIRLHKKNALKSWITNANELANVVKLSVVQSGNNSNQTEPLF